MTITLKPEVEEQLRRLAAERRQDIGTVVADALRQYMESEAITDVTSDQVSQTQAAMLPEI